MVVVVVVAPWAGALVRACMASGLVPRRTFVVACCPLASDREWPVRVVSATSTAAAVVGDEAD